MALEPTVLVVDDDPGIRLTMSRILEWKGCRVLSASGGGEALDVAERHDFDLGLVDFKMTGMDGGEVCAGLRRLNESAALYLVTAHVDPESERAALANGASGILHKPVDVRRLLAIVADHAEWQGDAAEPVGGAE